MKNLRYIAVVLTIIAVTIVTVSVHSVLFAGESVSADSSVPATDTMGTDNDSSLTDTLAPEDTYSPDSPDGSYLEERWGLGKIEAPEAWQITRGDPSIIVAVLDTGISRDNSDLTERVVAEVNFSDSATSDDLYGHGTHMAGTITSIAPGCRLMNVKVGGDTGRCDASVVAKGIIWAVRHGAKIINLSLVVTASADLEKAVDYAWDQGAVVIAAAGNKGTSEPSYPAYYDNCLAVAGTNENDSLALFSSFGEWVDVAAPGFNIYSELPHNQYGYKTGTSSAAAYVSGVAALVYSVAKDTNGDGEVNDEVCWAIENSCTPVAGDGMGHGLVNAFEAITGTIS